MKAVAKFEKVSFEQFKQDYLKMCNQLSTKTEFKVEDSEDEEFIKSIYDNIKLPKRATKGSAGYDFFAPFSFQIRGDVKFPSTLIPTGIRCKIDDGYVLKIYPRSGLGFKYRVRLNNTVGIIDSDYYNAKNEGHIMAKLCMTPDVNEVLNYCPIKQDEAFMQGVFVEYFTTYDDEVTEVRVGGLGSTSKESK